MRARLPILPALMLLAGGCGRTELDPGGSGGGAGAATMSTMDATAAPSPCTPGEDQTCNDNPATSALWGTCEPAGFCACAKGFSVSPKTRRCRAGASCVGMTSQPWAVFVGLDTSNCPMRPAACSTTAGTLEDRAQVELGKLVASACHLPSPTTLRVEILAGCPTLFELDRTTDVAVIGCLVKALSAVRWSCIDAGCALFELDTTS